MMQYVHIFILMLVNKDESESEIWSFRNTCSNPIYTHSILCDNWLLLHTTNYIALTGQWSRTYSINDLEELYEELPVQNIIPMIMMNMTSDISNTFTLYDPIATATLLLLQVGTKCFFMSQLMRTTVSNWDL